jgi:hypothetical protein
MGVDISAGRRKRSHDTSDSSICSSSYAFTWAVVSYTVQFGAGENELCNGFE